MRTWKLIERAVIGSLAIILTFYICWRIEWLKYTSWALSMLLILIDDEVERRWNHEQ